MSKRLLTLTLTLLWAAGAVAASSADEARSWIKRMNDALVNRNYDGVLTHKWQDGSESLRLIHRMRDGVMIERVISTDGSRREEIRNGKKWFRYLPENRIVLAQTRNRSYGYIATLNGLNADSENYYTLTSGGVQRLLGWAKPTQVISVEPKDAQRYGYRFWLDPQSAMPVKTQLVTRSGDVVDEISFSSLRMLDAVPDEMLRAAVDARTFQWKSLDVRSEAVKQAFVPRASLLPPGFRVANIDLPSTDGTTGGPRTRFIVSDGISWVSVVVTVADRPEADGFTEGYGTPMGASTSYVIRRDNHFISVMGEVPQAVVKSIAQAVRLSSGAGLLLLSRPDCSLCDEFADELARFGLQQALPEVRRIDVDSDPELARRHGLDIPVLLLDGMKVCQHHLDRDELRRLLRPR